MTEHGYRFGCEIEPLGGTSGRRDLPNLRAAEPRSDFLAVRPDARNSAQVFDDRVLIEPRRF
jgi:hypothetical protein